MLDIGKLDLDDPMVNLVPNMETSGDEKPSESSQHTITPPIRQVAASQKEGIIFGLFLTITFVAL